MSDHASKQSKPTRRQATKQIIGASVGLASLSSISSLLPTHRAGAAEDTIASRALAGAAALNLKGKTVRVIHPAGMDTNFMPFVEEWRTPLVSMLRRSLWGISITTQKSFNQQ